MDWNDLRYFLAVARAGSLSAASRTLNISQATIGRRIQVLEGALGTLLFDRVNTGYVLTPAGRDILPRAEAAEAAIISVARGADAGKNNLQGGVRLATGEALASHLIAPHMGHLHNRHPALRIEFVTGVRAVSLSRREADLALRLIRPDDGNYVRRQVGAVGFGLYAATTLLERTPEIKQDPWDISFISWDASMQDTPMAAWVKGRALSRTVATTTSMNVQLALAKAGLGAALLPCFVADLIPGLSRVLGPVDVGSLDLWLVTHGDLSRAPRVRAVLDFVGDICSQERVRLRGY